MRFSNVPNIKLFSLYLFHEHIIVMALIYLTMYTMCKQRDYVCDSQQPGRFPVNVMQNCDILP